MITGNLTSFDRKILSGAVVLLLLFCYLLFDDHLLMGWVSAQGAKVATLTKTKDDVKLKYAQDFRFVTAHRGEIHKGDTLFTGPASEATLMLNDKTIVHIEENSLIVFNMSGDQLSLILKQGHLEGNLEGIKIQESMVAPKPTNTKIVTQRPTITMPKAYEKKEIQIGPDGKWDSRPVAEIHWTYDKPSVKFQLQISSDPQFNQIEHTQITKERTAFSPELITGSHFIRVREVDEKNSHSTWSKVAQVEVMFASPKLNLSLTAPKYKQENIALAINDRKPILIEWAPVPGAQSYLAEISNDPAIINPKIVSTEKTQLYISDYTPGKLFFRVTALTATKEMGPKGNIGNAVVGVNPPKLLKTGDQDFLAKDDKDLPPEKIFRTRWESVPTISKYQLQVSDKPEFSSSTPITLESTETVNKISKPGKYYWRVRALDKKGQPISGYSDASVFNYSYGQPLTPPQLIEPAENMTLFFQEKLETPFYLAWAEPEVPGDYVLQIAKDDQFKEVVLNKKSRATKYLINGNLPKGDLYWRVRVVSGDRQSGWSNPRKLTLLAGRAAKGEN